MIDTYHQALRWFRRFSNDKVKEGTRQVAKLTTGGNALVLFDIMMKQAKEYENMIEPLVQCLQTCNDMSLDICAFSIVRFLSDNKES